MKANMSIIPAFRTKKQGHLKFESSLDYMMRLQNNHKTLRNGLERWLSS